MKESSNKRISISRDKLCWILFYFVIFFVVYNLFLNTSFGSDKVSGYANSPYSIQGEFRILLGNGRYAQIPMVLLKALLLSIFDLEHELGFQQITQVINLVLYAISAEYAVILVLKNVNSKNKNLNIFIHLIMIISFVNPYFVELFIYPYLLWPIGIIYTLAAVDSLVKKKRCSACVWLFLGISTYQNYLSLFIIWSFLVLLLKDDFKKPIQSLKLYVEPVFLVGAMGLLNLLSLQVLFKLGIVKEIFKKTGGYPEGFIAHILTLIKVFLLRLKDGYGMLPEYFLFCLCVLLFILVIYGSYGMYKRKISVLCIAIISGSMLCVPFAIGLLMDALWMPPRITFMFFFAISALFILISRYLYEFKISRLITTAMAVVTIGVLVTSCIRVSLDIYISNALDKEYVDMIHYEIDKYEEESGVEINKVAARTVGYENPYYWNEIFTKSTYAPINGKIVYAAWSDVEWLNFWTKEDYEEINMPNDIFSEQFGGKSWSCFDADEQLYFEDDTLYWAIY